MNYSAAWYNSSQVQKSPIHPLYCNRLPGCPTSKVWSLNAVRTILCAVMLLRRIKARRVLIGCVVASWLLASARLWLLARIETHGRISCDGFFGLGFALTK